MCRVANGFGRKEWLQAVGAISEPQAAEKPFAPARRAVPHVRHVVIRASTAFGPEFPGAPEWGAGFRDLWQRRDALRLSVMRDRETIDSELRRIALRRHSIRQQGGQPSCLQVDEQLDERLGHLPGPSKTETAREQIRVVTPPVLKDVAPRGRKSALRRFGPLALLPLSLLAVGASFATMFGSLNQQSADAVEEAPPPASSAPNPPPPQAQAPPVDVADTVFIDVLKKDGVPVPSHEYVTTHGRAVCGFLARQPDFAEAVRFVQRSSMWDADQSANVAAGAVVMYCPQYETATRQMQPSLPNSLPDLQAIQRDMQGIQNDLQGIRDRLPALPGQS
jgi:hypothetical protein